MREAKCIAPVREKDGHMKVMLQLEVRCLYPRGGRRLWQLDTNILITCYFYVYHVRMMGWVTLFSETLSRLEQVKIIFKGLVWWLGSRLSLAFIHRPTRTRNQILAVLRKYCIEIGILKLTQMCNCRISRLLDSDRYILSYYACTRRK